MANTLTVLVQADPFAGTASKAAKYVPQPDKGMTVQSNGTSVLFDNPKQAPETGSTGALLLEELRTAPRPILGVAVKPNTPAYAQVVTKDDRVIDLWSSSKFEPAGNGTSNNFVIKQKGKAWTGWFLQSVREDRMEKTQLVETFGDSYLYTYGEKPRSLTFQGILLNTDDYDWRADFWQNWEDNFRASKLVEKQARMYVRFDDILVEGYPINASVGQTSDSPNMMSFSFMFFVTNYVYLRMTSPRQSQQVRPYVATTNLNLASDQSLATINLQRQLTGFGAKLETVLNTASQAGLSELVRDKILTPGPDGSISKYQYLGYLAASGGIGLGFDALRAVRNSPQGALTTLATGSIQLAANLTKYLVAANVTEKSGMSLGEFNYWFGRASQLILFTTDLVESITIAATTGADGRPTNAGIASDAVASYARGLLVEGSADRIIDRLAYTLTTITSEALSPKPAASVTISFDSAEQALEKDKKSPNQPVNTLTLGL